MASFSDVQVVKTLENFFYIEWSFEPDGGYLESDYAFGLLWSQDPESGFQNVLDEAGDPVVIPPNQNYFLHEFKQYNFNITRYYQIKSVANFPPNEETLSNKVYVGMFSDGPQNVIHRNELVRVRLYCGEPCHIIKRHTFGARCPDCYNEYRENSDVGHCLSCNGSTFLYGWYQPIPIQIDSDANPKKSDSLKVGENTYDNRVFRIPNYPIVRPGDLVVLTGDNKRFEIVKVETTKLPMRAMAPTEIESIKLSSQNYILSQMLIVKEWVSSDDPYSIDIGDIPEIPDGDQPGGGYYPPAFLTVDPPLLLDGRHLSFLYNEDDFGVDGEGVFYLKEGGGTDLSLVTVAGEDIVDLFKAISILSDEAFYGDYTNPLHFNRVHGINLTVGNQGDDVTLIFGGTLYYENWNWNETLKIFFDSNGNLTQSVQPGGFYQYVGVPINSTTIKVDIGRCIQRVN